MGMKRDGEILESSICSVGSLQREEQSSYCENEGNHGDPIKAHAISISLHHNCCRLSNPRLAVSSYTSLPHRSCILLASLFINRRVVGGDDRV